MSYTSHLKLLYKAIKLSSYRLVREPVYRDVIRHRATKQVTYTCCPGWEQVSKNSYGCNKGKFKDYNQFNTKSKIK